MGDEIVINKQAFFDRLGQFYSTWKSERRSSPNDPSALFGGASSIVIISGKAEESATYQKHNALHFWLLGYEFPATLMVFTPDALWVVTTAKKARHLETLKNGKIAVETLVVSKDPESKTKAFDKCLDVIKGAGKKVGTLFKVQATGPFVDEWKKAFGDISKEVEEVEIGPALSMAGFAIKDEAELRSMRTASRACSGLIADYWVDEMSEVLDSGKKVSHKTLADKMDAKIDDAKFFSKLSKIGNDFDNQQLEWAYGPAVQSGGNFDLSYNATANTENLHAGIIIAGLGFRYKTYCSVVARTYLVDPTKAASNAYKLLLNVHEQVLQETKNGAIMKDIYNKALGIVRSKKPEMEKYFLKNVGHGIGIELNDSNVVIDGKNTKAVKDGMTFSIKTGFEGVPNSENAHKKDRTFSLLIIDTIRVTANQAAVFTKDAPSDMNAVEFFFNDDADEPTPRKEKSKPSRGNAIATNNIKSTRLRADRPAQPDEAAETRRRENQKELAAKKQKEGLERFRNTTGNQNGEQVKKFKRFESYKREDQLPNRIKDMVVYVDQRASTVILPIMGRPTPFHINTIKNVSKSEEGEWTHLRFNFLSPGQGVGRKDDQPFEDPSAHFVRSLTVRSRDQDRLSDVTDQITELRKTATRREQEKKEMEDVVELEKLVEIRNRRPQRLQDVFIRPAHDGKRIPGEVEIHQNGLKYVSPLRNDHVDIVFSNVKHLFFQPCVGEMIVLIHVYLKNPVLIGKRKTKDIQFFREATEMAFDETGNRKRKHRYGDEEEFEAEQEERRRRAELDRHFKAFAERIADAAEKENHHLGVDIPFRELGFHGVPFRSNVLMSPCTEALVQLTEPPFTVITLDEIEVAHLERIQFGLKNFDLVFVFKDFTRTPAHVNTIPVESLDAVKNWLDGSDIAYNEGPLNLNWGTIMKTVNADPLQFFKDGGWSFLNSGSDSEDSQEEENESAFEMSEDELEASVSSSEEDSEFDDDEDASADEGSAAGSDELSEDGEDWDELEKRAKRADRETHLDEGGEARKGGKPNGVKRKR